MKRFTRKVVPLAFVTAIAVATVAVQPQPAGAATDIGHDAAVAAYIVTAQAGLTSAQGTCLLSQNDASILVAPAGKTDTYYTNHFETADQTFAQPGHTCAAVSTNVIRSHTVVSGLQQDPLVYGGSPYDPNTGTGGPYGDETNVVIGWPVGNSAWMGTHFGGFGFYGFQEPGTQDCHSGDTIPFVEVNNVHCTIMQNYALYFSVMRIDFDIDETVAGWVVGGKHYQYWVNYFINGTVQEGCNQC